MSRFKFVFACFPLLLGACVQSSAGQPSIPPTEGSSLSGTLFAAPEGSVARTTIVACFELGDDCDEAKSSTFEVTKSGASAAFTISGLEAAEYFLFAVRDDNANGVLGDDGDAITIYGSDGLITTPATGADLHLPNTGTVDPNPGSPHEAESFIVKGRVTDTQGNPMAGVEVYADNTFGYNANIFGISDANGYYRIDVSGVVPSSWRVGGYHNVTYHGVNYRFSLHPDDERPFVGVDGAIRNLEWRLTGERPEGGFYGALVRVYEDYGSYDLELKHVELTFTPEGPLPDGSTPPSFTRTSENGMDFLDVPAGRYTITARYLLPGTTPSDLLIQVRDQGDFLPSTSALIRPHDLYWLLLELQVKKAS